MELDARQVAHVARLARIALSPEETTRYAADLSSILDFVARLDGVDTAGVEPLAHPLDLPARLREDVVSEADQRDLFLTVAPAAAEGLYRVPKVIE
jgi:aspartyl-tRNA(Asn)/glutamyl-tRNA(Gln) amidotransferase subunit C